MEHNRRTKIITIVVLVVIAFGLSIGFAVYSRNLNIQNVQASVTGDTSKFDVVFSTSSTSALTGTVTGNNQTNVPGVGGTATLSGTTISNLTASFSSKGGAVIYEFYAYNKGSIPAYLTGITFGEQTCTGAPGTNSELVSKACSGIEIGVTTNAGFYNSTDLEINNSSKLDPGKSEEITVVINGDSSINSVDGDFTATVPNITLNYSSQKLGS